MLVVPLTLSAQTLLDGEEDLDFDRPEAWAMKYFGSLVVMTGFGAQELGAGEWEVALEGGWVPTLSDQERRVGFIGDKEEDLNRTSVFGRLRASVGLPARFTLSAGYVPPVELDGVTPNLVSLALSHPVLERRTFRLDARVSAQGGTFEGDFTCPRAAAAGGDDPDANPFGCLEPSDDEMTVRSAGLELTGSWHPARLPAFTPYASVAGNWFDNEFQVRARYGTLVDRTLLRSDGTSFAATAGLSYRPGERTRLVAELFYSPLDVVRDVGKGSQNDALLNARVLVGFRLR
jgi:hypothetical protein